MTSFWNSKLARRNIKERFEKGAVVVDQIGRQAGRVRLDLAGDAPSNPTYFPLRQRMTCISSISMYFLNIAAAE